MQSKKRQHYFDQGLLRNFLAKGAKRLWVFDRVNNEYREQSTRDIAVQGHLYSIEKPEVEEHRFAIEDAFAKLGDRAFPAFQKLMNREELTKRERFDICEYLGYQVVRTPEMIEVTQNLTQKIQLEMMKEMMVQMASKPKDVYEKEMREIKEKTGIESDIKQEDWLSVVEDDRLRVDKSPDFSLGMVIESGTDIAVGFSKREWLVMHASSGATFIGSDSPVLLQTNTPELGRGPLSKGVRNFFAFSSDTAIMVMDSGPPTIQHATMTKRGVRQINDQLAISSNRIIFSHSKALLESLASRHRLSEWVPKIKYLDEVIKDSAKEHFYSD